MNSPAPPDFFADLADVRPLTPRQASALIWYDQIIDDILSHPGTMQKDIAKRIGKHASTVSLVMSSDMFKARYNQRRAEYNEALNQRLAAKLTQVAEKALEHTIKVLDTKRESVPLPLLHEITKGSLDRLGYAPQSNSAPAVVINNQQVSASSEALERARTQMKVVGERTQPSRSDSTQVSDRYSQSVGPQVASPPVAGPGDEAEGEDR